MYLLKLPFLLLLLLIFVTQPNGGNIVFAQSKQKVERFQHMGKTHYQGLHQIRNMNKLTEKFKEMRRHMSSQSERSNLPPQNKELYKSLEQLNNEIGDITMQMTKTMEHLQSLDQNKVIQQDREMIRETKKITEHLRKMSEEMNPTALSMERLQDRLSKKEN
jgi:hypothetical protein